MLKPLQRRKSKFRQFLVRNYCFLSFSWRGHRFFFIADPTPEVPPVENKYVAGDGEGSEDSDEDEEEVIEESPCGRYNKRREVVKYRFVAFIERNITLLGNIEHQGPRTRRGRGAGGLSPPTF